MASHPIRIGAAGGEYMESVLVTEWTKAVGEPVSKGEHLLTVETAKAATEIEAECDGWLAAISVTPGEEAPVDAVLGRISDSVEEVGQAGPSDDDRAVSSDAVAEAPADGAGSRQPRSANRSKRMVASPLARRVAAQRGIPLERIAGTGPRGRIKLRDLPATAVGASPIRPSSVALMPAGRPVPLVLLHGFGADSTSWRAARALLPREMEVHVLDLPGHGRQAARPALSLADIVSDLTDRLDAAGLDEVHLAGHSLGGAAALALAARGRQVVRSLCLIAPAGLGGGVDPGFLAGLVDATAPQALQVWLERMVADPSCLPRGYAEAAIAQARKQGTREPMRGMMHNLFPGGTPAFDLTAECSAVDVPFRLIWGREDRIIPSVGIEAVPSHAALHSLRGIGHVPQLEAPKLTARLLTETVRSAG